MRVWQSTQYLLSYFTPDQCFVWSHKWKSFKKHRLVSVLCTAKRRWYFSAVWMCGWKVCGVSRFSSPIFAQLSTWHPLIVGLSLEMAEPAATVEKYSVTIQKSACSCLLILYLVWPMITWFWPHFKSEGDKSSQRCHTASENPWTVSSQA